MFVVEVKIKHRFICDMTTRTDSDLILWMEVLLLIWHVTLFHHVMKGSCILRITRLVLYSC